VRWQPEHEPCWSLAAPTPPSRRRSCSYVFRSGFGHRRLLAGAGATLARQLLVDGGLGLVNGGFQPVDGCLVGGPFGFEGAHFRVQWLQHFDAFQHRVLQVRLAAFEVGHLLGHGLKLTGGRDGTGVQPVVDLLDPRFGGGEVAFVAGNDGSGLGLPAPRLVQAAPGLGRLGPGLHQLGPLGQRLLPMDETVDARVAVLQDEESLELSGRHRATKVLALVR